MYSLDSLWNIFDLEFFLFGGVPETAVQMYEREFHGHEEVRHTRECLHHDVEDVFEPNGECYRVVEFDPKTGLFSLVEGGAGRQ